MIAMTVREQMKDLLEGLLDPRSKKDVRKAQKANLKSKSKGAIIKVKKGAAVPPGEYKVLKTRDDPEGWGFQHLVVPKSGKGKKAWVLDLYVEHLEAIRERLELSLNEASECWALKRDKPLGYWMGTKFHPDEDEAVCFASKKTAEDFLKKLGAKGKGAKVIKFD